jgi:hypothetical protein
MKKPDPKAEMYLAKAKRFRQRAAGFRHTLARDDLVRSHRLELEQMVVNLEGAAKQLERMAKGEEFEMASEVARVRAIREGVPESSTALEARKVAAQVNALQLLRAAANLDAAAKGIRPPPAGGPSKPSPSRMAPRSAKFTRRPGG